MRVARFELFFPWNSLSTTDSSQVTLGRGWRVSEYTGAGVAPAAAAGVLAGSAATVTVADAVASAASAALAIDAIAPFL